MARVRKQENEQRRIETTKRLDHLQRTATISGSQMANFKSKLVVDSDADSSPESLDAGDAKVIEEEDVDADSGSSSPEDAGSLEESAGPHGSKQSRAGDSGAHDSNS